MNDVHVHVHVHAATRMDVGTRVRCIHKHMYLSTTRLGHGVFGRPSAPGSYLQTAHPIIRSTIIAFSLARDRLSRVDTVTPIPLRYERRATALRPSISDACSTRRSSRTLRCHRRSGPSLLPSALSRGSLAGSAASGTCPCCGSSCSQHHSSAVT